MFLTYLLIQFGKDTEYFLIVFLLLNVISQNFLILLWYSLLTFCLIQFYLVAFFSFAFQDYFTPCELFTLPSSDNLR